MEMTYKPSPADIKALREATLAGMSDCKKALEETNGDMEAARDWLRTKGLASAAKRADRAASAGMIWSAISENRQIGALVEVNSESDFVANNEVFQEFVRDLAQLVVDQNPTGVEDPGNPNIPGESLLNLNWKGNPQVNVGLELGGLLGKMGENIVIRRFTRFDLAGTPGAVDSYIHLGGKVGVLVEFEVSDVSCLSHPDFEAFRKDVAMHIAASNPEYVYKEQITEDALARERKIAEERTREEGKPEHVIPGIVEGRIKKWMSEVVLVMQQYVKEPDKNVEQYITESGKALGGAVKVRRFVRYALGG
ncbi:MAG: Elongation factor Ts [bacterium]|nr:Elongation factor Ts [bacterium]